MPLWLPAGQHWHDCTTVEGSMVQSHSSVTVAGSGTAGQGPHTAGQRLFGGHVILAEA